MKGGEVGLVIKEDIVSLIRLGEVNNLRGGNKV